jgi:hypothetical protein
MRKRRRTRLCSRLAICRTDELVHAIALAMVRRQMQQNWPRR